MYSSYKFPKQENKFISWLKKNRHYLYIGFFFVCILCISAATISIIIESLHKDEIVSLEKSLVRARNELVSKDADLSYYKYKYESVKEQRDELETLLFYINDYNPLVIDYLKTTDSYFILDSLKDGDWGDVYFMYSHRIGK